MSTEKRKEGPDEAAEGTDEPHSASPRKRWRLSLLLKADRTGEHVERDKIQHGTYKPTSDPLQPFRQHRRVTFVSDGARPSKRNKRPTFGHLRPNKVPTTASPNSSPYSGPPEQFDVTPGLLDAVTLADGETSYWKTEHAAFIRSAAGLDNANWIGKRPLGSGSFGTAGLWELRDENNDQIVVKESKTIADESWTGEVPEEVRMMRRMNKTDCQAVPYLIDYKRYLHVKKHRIYMEYCPYSDLATLNLNYKRFRTYLPEPFLWYTFNNLVKVAEAMKNGPKNSRWGYQIVHRDLKPANIFLGLEDKDCGFSSYPVAKTGDWGLAKKIEPDNHRNPLRLRGAGTESYFAPEQRVLFTGDALRAQVAKHLNGTAPLLKLSAHTNIWGIGAIMFELLTHEAVAYYLNDDEWTVNEAFTDIPNVRNPKYSDALTELIKLCLMPEPWDRPSIEELELKIGARCQSIEDGYVTHPSLHQQDRLYYRGSEINKMPPGNWHYWNPVMKDVQRPSAPPDSNEPNNPFTDTIFYPPFSTSELDDPEEEGPSGDKPGNPIVISDNDEEDGPDERNDRSERNELNESDEVDDREEGNWVNENDESNGSEEEKSSGGSDDSDDSDVRRRMAIKKLPGT